VGVSILTLNGKLVQSFPSQTAAAKWLNVSQQTVSYALKRGSIVKGMYVLSNKG